MNILFITIAWPPSGERNLYSDLMEEFVLNGHTVYVVTTQQSPNSRRCELAEENGISIVRVNSAKISKVSYFRKIVSLSTLGPKMSSAIKTYLNGCTFDLILGPTPPITLSRLFRRLKKKHKAKFYLLLKDIWPQGSVDHGVIKKYGIPWLYLRRHEIRLYKTADFIGCMSSFGVKYLLSHNKSISKEKVEVCPNSIRPVFDTPKENSCAIRVKYNIPEDSCVFIFSGNLGIGHGLHFLIEAIQQLSRYKKAFFLLGGSGTHYDYLKGKLEELSPDNALLYSRLPREEFEELMITSDVGLILLYKYTSPQFPSRLLSYLEYSKPVLCAINKETDMGIIVETSGCGKYVIHGDMEGFISSIKYFAENAEERRLMGNNARKLLLDHYTAKQSYEIIIKHFIE